MEVKQMSDDELYHHGILGMKWGVRRYQNADGTLTPKGKARYMKVESSKHLQKSETKKARKILSTHVNMDPRYALSYNNMSKKSQAKAKRYMEGSDKYNKYMKKAEKNARRAKEHTRNSIYWFRYDGSHRHIQKQQKVIQNGGERYE